MIRIGIFGYGNLGKGVENAIEQNEDMMLSAIFTRRPVDQIHPRCTETPVCSAEQAPQWRERIDVMILCGGSATDLPEQTPWASQYFSVVDSFDTHAKIPEHFAAVDQAARAAGTTALISAGWDPGMFSLQRAYAQAVLPCGETATFWGRGVSQGHSDAIRRISGVADARQYTIPVPEAVQAAREGRAAQLTTRQRHTRECFVVLKPGADAEKVRQEIVTMPNYFSDYDTTVHFISQEELNQQHGGMPHGGMVLRSGNTGRNGEHRHIVEYHLQLDSNPEFTSSILVSCARAVSRLAAAGETGCKTLLDVPPAFLLAKDGAQLRKELL